MHLNIEVETESDGRWVAEVPELSGAMSYGTTREEAILEVKALALRVLEEGLEHRKPSSQPRQGRHGK